MGFITSCGFWMLQGSSFDHIYIVAGGGDKKRVFSKTDSSAILNSLRRKRNFTALYISFSVTMIPQFLRCLILC